MAEKPADYTVVLPGFQDVIKIPLTPEEEKREKRRIQAEFALRNSPQPDIVQCMATILNNIDDVEDLISTALILGRPLLRRALPRFAPGLGFILLGTQIADIATFLLSVGMVNVPGKRGMEIAAEKLSIGRKANLDRVADFLRKKPGFGFFLEAGQSLDLLTGYGLQLGPIFGTLNEGIWSIIRSAQGATVNVRGAALGNFGDKVFNFLRQLAGLPIALSSLQAEVATSFLVATNVAIDFLLESPNFHSWGDRVGELATTALVRSGGFEPDIVAALKDLDIDPEKANSPCNFSGDHNANFAEAIQAAVEGREAWLTDLKNIPKDEALAQVQAYLINEIGEKILTQMISPAAIMKAVYPDSVKGILRMAAEGIYGTPSYTLAQLETINSLSWRYHFQRAGPESQGFVVSPAHTAALNIVGHYMKGFNPTLPGEIGERVCIQRWGDLFSPNRGGNRFNSGWWDSPAGILEVRNWVTTIGRDFEFPRNVGGPCTWRFGATEIITRAPTEEVVDSPCPGVIQRERGPTPPFNLSGESLAGHSLMMDGAHEPAFSGIRRFCRSSKVSFLDDLNDIRGPRELKPKDCTDE